MKTIRKIFHLSAERVAATIVFILTLSIYSLTLSPSVSLWDCGEFILSARWLEVGHPPGAPFYIILARLFSMFASSVEDVAWCVNMLSAVATALSASLMFLISQCLIRWAYPSSQRWLSIVSSAIGAIAMAVSDTIWFSAVETEVYALSLFFTTLTIFLTLRWRINRDTHLLALIALSIGISAGVHLLNMLVLPVIFMTVFMEYRGWSVKNAIVSFVIGIVLLAFVVFGLIANGLQLAMILEMLLCVSLHMPVHSGLILFVILLFLSLFAMLFITRKRGGLLHLSVLTLLLFSIGYSSNALIIIRACANPTINLNQPDNVFTLNSVVNREQYGDTPIFYGQWYGSHPTDIKREMRFVVGDSSRYVSSYDPVAYVYPSDEKVFFPRMYSSAPQHVYGYGYWADIDVESSEPPSLGDEMFFMMRYQLYHMYVRYFMWNFSGRQNDLKGIGNATEGNWISGIPLIDSYLGQREAIHPDESWSNARTVYYMLPFILGLVGLAGLFCNSRKRQVLLILFLLFILMGPAIAIYLNQQPYEPRERDYAYAGSFMIFCIFISMGAYILIESILKLLPRSTFSKALVSTLVFMAVPMLMFAQNLRSHNRNGRLFDLALAKSYLALCEPNAVLFTEGDNDTFPLWYVQEVEGYRRDVRVVNYGLIGTKWYDAQIAKPHRGAKGVDMDNLFADNSVPVYIIPNGTAMEEWDCQDFSVDLGLVARVLPDTNNIHSIDRTQLFLDSLDFPSASSYTMSYDVISTFKRIRYRLFACQASSEALERGDSDTAAKILIRSLSVFPINASPMADGNIELAQLLHIAGRVAEANQVFRIMAQYYLESVEYIMAESEKNILRSQQYYDTVMPFGRSLVSALKSTGNDELLAAIEPYVSSSETE